MPRVSNLVQEFLWVLEPFASLLWFLLKKIILKNVNKTYVGMKNVESINCKKKAGCSKNVYIYPYL